jgi:hypothetical protein
MVHQYKYYVLGHSPSSCLYLKCRPVYLSKHNFSETGFCLRLQVRPTQSPKGCVLQDKQGDVLDKDKMVNNICTSIPI